MPTPNLNSNKLLQWLYYLVPAVALFLFIMGARTAPPSDWAAYYFGGNRLMKFDYVIAYNTNNLNYAIEQLGYKNILVSYAPFPPYTALVTAPFTSFLSLETSKIVFNIFSSALFLFTLYRAFRFFSIPRWLLLLVPLLFYTALRNNIYFGQGYLVLVSLLLEGYMAHKQGRHILASFCWGLAILFKIFPACIVIWLFFRKDWKAILYLAIAGIILFLPSLYFNGLDSWVFYITKMLPRANNGELNNPFIYIFQSAFMLLKNVFVPDTLFNPDPLIPNRYLFVISWIIFRAFVIAGAITATIQKKQEDLVTFSIWIMASMLISPNGSSYSLILFIIPAFALLKLKISVTKNPIFLVLAIAIFLFVICNIPVYKFASYPLFLQYPRLYCAIILFFIFLLLSLRRLNYVALIACALLFLIPDISKFKPITDKSTYLLSKEEHILIYNYQQDGNNLVYDYRDETGAHLQETGIMVNSLSDWGVEIIDHQIWYKGKQLTNTSDVKIKPQVLNDQYIIYISDKDRGIGFSTLRKIPLN